MNRFIFSIWIAMIPFKVFGQLFPLSDNYVYDALNINPAFAGCLDGLSTTLMDRNQWIGINGAPQTFLLSVHTSVDNDRIGLGLLVDENSIGILKETNVIGNYAYRMEVFNGKLALGLGFGITEYQIAWNGLNISDANDPELINNPSSAWLPAFSAGMYYYTNKAFIGISLPLFVSNELNQNAGNYQINIHTSDYNYFVNAGYEVGLSSQVKILPSVLIKYHPTDILQIDYNAIIDFQNKIWLGLSYRSSNTVIARLKIQINYQLKLVYSYDYDMGSIGKYENGTHEIGLNYVFNYLRKVKGPRQ